MTEPSTEAAGIDTGKSTLNLALASGLAGVQVDNDAARHRRLASRLRGKGVVARDTPWAESRARS